MRDADGVEEDEYEEYGPEIDGQKCEDSPPGGGGRPALLTAAVHHNCWKINGNLGFIQSVCT